MVAVLTLNRATHFVAQLEILFGNQNPVRVWYVTRDWATQPNHQWWHGLHSNLLSAAHLLIRTDLPVGPTYLS